MGALENALSEELPSPAPLSNERSSPPRAGERIASAPPPSQQRATEKDKMVAACVGAVLTSLTMTPFDVVKTRLQTAPSHSSSSFSSLASSSFSSLASSSSAPASAARATHTPYPPPVPSTSTTSAPSLRFFQPSSLASSASASAALTLPLSHSPSFPSPSPSPSPSPRSRPPRSSQPQSGFLPTLSQILRTEGPTALWRGTSPTLLMSVPGQVVYMLGYDWGRRTAFAKAPSWARTAGTAGEGREGRLRAGYVTAVPLVAGAASRTVVAALLSPFELLRTQLQAQSASSRRGLLELVKELRWSTAWRGLGPTLWRDVPFSAVYWAGYEGVKRGLTGGRGMGESGVGVGGAGRREQESVAERLGLGEFGVAFVSGAGSGMLAATLTNPFDVIKTRRQALVSSPSSSSAAQIAKSTNTFSLLLDIAREEGVKGWFRGLTPRLAKVGPACGLMIGCYEALSSFSSASRAVAQARQEGGGHAAAE
ncbi:hypothetical protein JCM8547_005057 [Rhodosporidiobolus lusitaniae]